MSHDAYPPQVPPGSAPPAPPAPPAPSVSPASAGTLGLLGVLLVGAAVSVVLGVFGGLHRPTGVALDVAGFSGPQEVKAWLASVAFALALVQAVSALAMYGRLPLKAPPWTASIHRWSGRLAFLTTIPVAVHCLYALGFGAYDLRVLVHSVVGCMFFGAFTVKMLSLSKDNLPGWVLPLFGGVVLTGLSLIWLSSALWFFTTFGVRF